MTTQSIVLIDSRVTEYETLVRVLGARIKSYLQDTTEDGVEQGQRLLCGYADLSAFHNVTDGPTGVLYLTNAVLIDGTFTQQENEFHGIVSAMLYRTQIADKSEPQLPQNFTRRIKRMDRRARSRAFVSVLSLTLGECRFQGMVS